MGMRGPSWMGGRELKRAGGAGRVSATGGLEECLLCAAERQIEHRT